MGDAEVAFLRVRRPMTMTLAALALLTEIGCGEPRTEGEKNLHSQAPIALSAPYLWWEAENPKSTDFPATNPFDPANETERAVLSAGKWIGAPEKRDHALFLEYEVEVPEAGKYGFYARKFWKHGPYRWRFDNGPWTEVRNPALLDDAYMRKFLGANWTPAGMVDLTKGKHTVRIELLENQGAANFDAFVLTKGYFDARGKLKPGEKSGGAPAGWFAFEPDADPFRPSPIDLRSLNEKSAGENGFIGVKGEEFVHGKTGTPVRFWAMNTGHDILELDDLSLAYYARSLAKGGVNLVRLHGGPWGSDFRTVPPENGARIARFVDALKKEGIYTCLSIYFPLWLNFDEKSGFAGYSGGKHPFSLLYFSPEFQKIYRGWWTSLLNARTPSGVALKDEPAVAMMEMVNEDSHLFWTFTPDNIPAPQMQMLQKQFGDWAKRKYGTLDKALAFWNRKVEGDDAGGGRVAFPALWEIFNTRDLRNQDTATFLAENMKSFYDGTYAFLKKDLGVKSTVYGSNWITASPQYLQPLDKWANLGADFMDRHGYFGGPHEGPAAGYSVSPGDKYDDRSQLLFSPDKPGEQPNYSLPLFDIQYNGKPSTITEINVTPPNRYRADQALAYAAYGLLQGTDAFFFFASGTPGWERSLGKFAIRTPVTAAQFPGTAFLYRKGLVKPGPVVAESTLELDALKALKGAPLSAPQNLDELRLKDVPGGKIQQAEPLTSIDPLAFLTGKVRLNLGIQGKSSVTDLTKLIDRSAKVARSATGELTWDWGNGRILVNSAESQGATGFLKGWNIATADATFSLPLDYGAALLVAMDGKPIASSSKMLLQVMSEDMPSGWKTSAPTGMRTIESVGGWPFVVKNLEGTVTLKRADAAKLRVTPLDFNGYPKAKATSSTSIKLQSDTIYYLIEK